ncbi:hypothetical protein JRQ81_009864 [Phrynocephalus forsythii]|uniref:Nucleolar 27S pre-rRNA processing Urb2/Npa2 C-terminal domain-containing protein n=1 Tax=Phrynocephalus forsythii TaxID=171643 RepID=A0A9Q1B6K2_9SAUR|nr:hypothetical protein JRQ81_009864 [Phrynocephalus forsythii]
MLGCYGLPCALLWFKVSLKVLLDWVSHTLVSYYNKKLELPDEIVEKLWMYLDSILHSRKLQSLMKDGKMITLRFSIAQVINERLSTSRTHKTQKNLSTVLSCCHGILSVAPLSIVYSAKFELLVDLLSKLFWLACRQLSSEATVSSQLFEVLRVTLEQYLLIQRQQANANRIFGQVTKHLFQPSLLLRHLLATGGPAKEEDDRRVHPHVNRDIRNHIENLLKASIFQPELLMSYREELLQDKESHHIKKSGLKNLLLPASTVQKALQDANIGQGAVHGKVVANSVPFLFKLFLESYSKAEDHLVCFHMLTKLFQCLRLSRLQEGPCSCPGSSLEWSSELLALEQLLNLVLSGGIYNVAADRIRHQEIQFRFYRQLAQMLVNNSQATIPAWFRCLKALIFLNHLIVEPDLDDVVASAWIDAEMVEPRVRKAQEGLVGTLFQTYAKLRQFQKLFEEVLSVVSRPAAEELRLPILPAGIKTKLCECLLELPPNQILDVASLILEKCHTVIIPDVRGDADMALKLQSVGTLLHVVLFYMRSLDDSTPLPVVRRTQSLLETMQRDVIQALFNLLNSVQTEETELWAEKVGDCALLLACTWVATDTLFCLNCKQYVSPLAKTTVTLTDGSIDPWDFSAVLPGLDAQSWEKITKCLRHSYSTSRYCTEWLVLQKMKKLLIQSSSWTEAPHPTLQHAGAFILHSGRSCLNTDEFEPWDGNVGTITSGTYATAHWHLVVSNLPVLFPYLSLKDTLYVARVLLKTLLESQTQALLGNDDDSLITAGKVSKDLLHSSLLPEMHALHSSFLTHIVQRCARVLRSAVPKAENPPLQQLSAEDVLCIWQRVFRRLDSRGESSSEYIVVSESEVLCSLEEEHIRSLEDVLETVSALRLDSLFPLDHTRCFLLLMSLSANTKASLSCSEALSLKYLATCFHLLACLQTGRHANAAFKVMRGSDVLEALLTSTFAACEMFARVVTTGPWDRFLGSIRIFLEHYLRVILERRQSVRLNLEKFMSFLATCQPQAGGAKQAEMWGPAAEQLFLVAQAALCCTLTKHLQAQQGKPQALGILPSLLEQAVLQTGAAIRLCLRHRRKGQPLPFAFIPCLTTLLQADSFCAHAVSLVAEESQAEGLTKPSPFRPLSHEELYCRCYLQILRELDLAGGNVQFLRSALEFLTAFSSLPGLYPAHGVSLAVFHSVRKLLVGPGITVQLIQDLEVQLTELMVQLVERCSTDDFCVVLRVLLEGLDVENIWKQHPEAVLSAVTLMKVLLSCPLTGEKHKAFWHSSPQIITALVVQAKEASQDPVLLPTLIVPILEMVALLLRQGEGILSNPHHVSLAFNILLTVPLDQRDYGSIFLGIHEVLFAILQCHPKVMLKAAPSFLNSFHRLVISIMHEGRQKGDRGTTDDFDIILKCAQLVERMYTYIAAKTEEFTVLSAFIVAQYVIELQKVTLHPLVKKHLTEGIYHILDLCRERDMKFLNTSLPAGVREVLQELHRDYTHYHKAVKQGDEKYAA